MRKPWNQIHPVGKFFISIGACIVLVFMVVYVVIKTLYARAVGKRYYWKSDTIK